MMRRFLQGGVPPFLMRRFPMALPAPPRPNPPHTVIRYTVIDPRGTVSFVAPVESLKPLIAACSHRPVSVGELLRAVRPYDDQLADEVTRGLAVFDEHVTADHPERLHELLDAAPDHAGPVFRVLDERSRQESMRAVRGGLILFNLKAQRIVQVHNNLVRVRRRDRGRVRASGVPMDGNLYSYELPEDWSLVP
jgi:hypothetical protein